MEKESTTKYYRWVISSVLVIYMASMITFLSSEFPILLFPPFLFAYSTLIYCYLISFGILGGLFILLWIVPSKIFIPRVKIENVKYFIFIIIGMKLGTAVILLFLKILLPGTIIIFLIFLVGIEIMNIFEYNNKIDAFIIPTAILIFFYPELAIGYVLFFISIQYAVALITLFFDEYRWLNMLAINIAFIVPIQLFYPSLFYVVLIIAFGYSIFKYGKHLIYKE